MSDFFLSHLSINIASMDKVLDDIATQGFSMIDQIYPLNYVTALQQECMEHFNQFRDAAIQNGVMNNIRSDHILWINADLPFANQHLTALKQFSAQLNRYLFTGINDVEAHFACYNIGEFYALHRDNPQQKNGRVISAVFYLHQEWQENWGGELRLQDTKNLWHIIPPLSNRLAIFQSDLLHEVLPAKQQRLSITAWLRNDQKALI